MKKSALFFKKLSFATIILFIFIVTSCASSGGTTVVTPAALTPSAAAAVPSISSVSSPANSPAPAALPGGITPNASVSPSPTNIPAACPDSFVVELAEGPFYKSGSPQRTELVETGVAGIPFTLTGYVFDKNCTPIAGAWIDFWQADGNGSYDNADYKLRGYQLTDEQGKYTLHTVFPGLYPGRTNHIHVKLSKSQSLAGSESAGSIVTSQIFFPGASQNSTDSIFDESMVVTLSQGSDGQYAAFFNFKINQ